MQSSHLQQHPQVHIAFPVHLEQLYRCPANRGDANDERFIFIPLEMRFPLIVAGMKEPGKLISERVEMVRFVVLVPIEATICQGKIFRGGSAAKTQRDDMVERERVRREIGRNKAVFAITFRPISYQLLYSKRDTGFSHDQAVSTPFLP